MASPGATSWGARWPPPSRPRFNAPIAGALFALEVVLRHFALHAFAPIVIASVAGTVISRLHFGDVTEFALPADSALGILCGIARLPDPRAGLRAGRGGADARRCSSPRTWPTVVQRALRHAALAAPGGGRGCCWALIAIRFPHIIGVGYETTSAALTGQLLLHEAVVFAVVKVAAVAITLGGRMGGGVFSPSLMVGALTGLAFGLMATAILPDYSGAATLYALAGMGAVAAAVLGAPISTTLIVFELTGDWQTGLAVMVAVSTSVALSARLVRRSFFLTQLRRRGHAACSPGRRPTSPQSFPVEHLMRHRGADDGAPEFALLGADREGVSLDAETPRWRRRCRVFDACAGRSCRWSTRIAASGQRRSARFCRVDALIAYVERARAGAARGAG
ncbi:MAG: chloride channel protein [Roseovarius sp.]|nr:chloride channel protein [Roseovarius sp.]